MPKYQLANHYRVAPAKLGRCYKVAHSLKQITKSSTILCRILKRSEFVMLSRGKRISTYGLILQAKHRQKLNDIPKKIIRVGFTCSKKVGNSVARNKAKRRLREAVNNVVPQYGETGWDYVVIGKKNETAKIPFNTLQNSLAKAMKRIHSQSRNI